MKSPTYLEFDVTYSVCVCVHFRLQKAHRVSRSSDKLGFTFRVSVRDRVTVSYRRGVSVRVGRETDLLISFLPGSTVAAVARRRDVRHR